MKRPFPSYKMARIHALQAAADILADASEDPEVFEIDELTEAETRAAMEALCKIAIRLQKEAWGLENISTTPKYRRV